MMKNRIYGVLGIQTKMSNFNADFSGLPRTSPLGEYITTDKPIKYALRKLWSERNKNVLIFKSFKVDTKKDNIQITPRTLEENYNYIFGNEIAKEKNKLNTLKNLFSCIDVKQFGVAFPIAKNNFSITGAVQISYGINKYKDTNISGQTILSPFRNSNNEESTQTSLGEQFILDEAHFYYDFNVNPNNYKIFKDILGNDFEGYTEKDYEEIKQDLLNCVTAINSNTKLGSNNEFAMFIRIKEDSNLYLSNLSDLISIEKNTKNPSLRTLKVDLSKLEQHETDIENIEIYYNKLNINLELLKNIKNLSNKIQIKLI